MKFFLAFQKNGISKKYKPPNDVGGSYQGLVMKIVPAGYHSLLEEYLPLVTFLFFFPQLSFFECFRSREHYKTCLKVDQLDRYM